jgi:hypothetical protein
MLGDMMRFSSVLLVGAVALSAEAAPRSKGKVVRVERLRGATTIPRLCVVLDDSKALCFGAEPQPSELITVLDQTGVVGEARVGGPTAFPGGIVLTCKIVWPITVTTVRGDLTKVKGQAIGVIDGELDPRHARLFADDALPPSPAGTSERVVLAIDGNADSTPDLELTEYTCNGGQAGRGKCFAEWTRRGGQLTRVLALDTSACGF